ncbi:hypothetical protein [Gleimia hominis]|nr:hypothetical protein [Gleimia hominis]WIK64858.1 hypothetical protein CJ187_002010 [Gleimia hominis]
METRFRSGNLARGTQTPFGQSRVEPNPLFGQAREVVEPAANPSNA